MSILVQKTVGYVTKEVPNPGFLYDMYYHLSLNIDLIDGKPERPQNTSAAIHNPLTAPIVV